jgi:acid phosphatase
MVKRNGKHAGLKKTARWRGMGHAIFTILAALAHRKHGHRARAGTLRARTVIGVLLVQLIAACSGGTDGNPASQDNPTAVAPSITAQPKSTTVTVGQTASFTVTATGTAPLAYQWRRSGSAIAGATAASYTTAATSAADGGAAFSVVVTNSAGTVTSGNAILTVSPTSTSTLSITTSTLPAGVVQTVYTETLQATGGKTPYAWTVVSGQLPAGLVLSGTTGTISGTPTTAGSSSFGVSVHDAAGASATLAASIAIGAAALAGTFGHVVIVVEENANYSSVVGDTAAMPYLNSLIDSYGLATQYYSNTHPSIGNYMMLVTGQVLTNDDGETPETFPVSANNVVRQLAANGKTWKAYAEDLPSVGYTGGNTGNYAVRHVPLAYLTDVQDSAAGKETLVPFTQFATDLASGKLPDYSFVTPNLCNDAHNCALSVADAWLKTNIAPLLASTPFKDDGVLIIVFDESGDDDTHGGGRIAAVIISPKFSKVGYQSTTLYQHQSTLRLMLEGLGITTALPGASATAPTMWEFFDTPP